MGSNHSVTLLTLINGAWGADNACGPVVSTPVSDDEVLVLTLLYSALALYSYQYCTLFDSTRLYSS